MGPNPTQHKGRANMGFLLEQKPGGGWPESGSTPPHLISSELCWGRGQDNYWSLNLAASFYSTFPRINYPKTSSISKKGNC